MFRDLVADVLISLSRHPARTSVRALAVAAAVGLLAASTVWSGSSVAAVTNTFDELRSDTISVDFRGDQLTYSAVTLDMLDGLNELPGVRSVASVEAVDALIYSHPESPWRTEERRALTLFWDGDPDALGIELLEGSSRSPEANTVLIGSGLAGSLDIEIGDGVLVHGVVRTVSGVVVEADRYPDALTALLIEDRVSTASIDQSRTEVGQTTIVVHIQRGLASDLAPAVLSIVEPVRPETLLAIYQPEIRSLEATIRGQVGQLVAVTTASILAVAGLLELASAWLSVRSQYKLLALRLALGESRWRLVLPIVAEAGVLALLGSVAGGIVGTIIGSSLATRAGLEVDWIARATPLGAVAATIAAMAASAISGLVVARIDPARILREP